MLTFVAPIVTRWLGGPPPNLAEARAHELLDIVEVGLEDSIIGPSADKVFLTRVG